MKPRKITFFHPAAAACLLLLGAVAAQAQGVPRSYTRSFPLDHVDPRVAEAWFWELCDELAEFSCRVEQSVNASITAHGPDEVHAAFSRRLAERDIGRTSREFQILLIEAAKGQKRIDRQLPENARQALEDVAEFLPFSDFQLIDSGFMKTSGRGQVEMSGPDGTRYETALAFDPELRLEGVVLQIGQLQVRAVQPSVKIAEDGEGQTGPRVRMFINSSLTLEPGETAVVGTSKLNGGDRALVVLLTAVK